MYETLKQYEEEVNEILEEKNKKEQISASPVALVAEKKSLKGLLNLLPKRMWNIREIRMNMS